MICGCLGVDTLLTRKLWCLHLKKCVAQLGQPWLFHLSNNIWEWRLYSDVGDHTEASATSVGIQMIVVYPKRFPSATRSVKVAWLELSLGMQFQADQSSWMIAVTLDVW